MENGAQSMGACDLQESKWVINNRQVTTELYSKYRTITYP